MSYNITSLNPAVSDWVAFTPTGSWVTNVTYTGFWRRNGDRLECQIKVLCSGAPDNTGLILNLPSGMAIDTSKIFNSAKPITVGTALISDNGIADYEGYILWASGIAAPTTTVMVLVSTASGTYTDASAAVLSTTVPMTWAVNDCISCEFSMPIVGWSSNIQTIQASTEYASNSSVADAADTTSFAYGPSGSVGLFGTTALSDDRKKRCRFLSAIQPTDVITLSIWDGLGWTPHYMNGINGSFMYTIQGTSVYGIYIDVVNTTDVDVGFCRYARATGLTFGAAGEDWSTYSNTTRWRLEKRSGLAAGEVPPTVYASYNTAASLSLANSAIMQWDTKVEDTHNAVTTGAAWKFTAPIAGVYSISAIIGYATAESWAAASQANMTLYVGGSSTKIISITRNTAAITGEVITCSGTTTIRLTAGQYIDIRAYQTGTRTTYADAKYNHITITRIGG
jgi:hypothetical protein